MEEEYRNIDLSRRRASSPQEGDVPLDEAFAPFFDRKTPSNPCETTFDYEDNASGSRANNAHNFQNNRMSSQERSPLEMLDDLPSPSRGAYRDDEDDYIEKKQQKAEAKAEKRRQKREDKAARNEGNPPPKGKRKKHRIRNRVLGCLFVFLVLCAGGLATYVHFATANDALWLDLDQLPYKDGTILYADAGDGTWVEYARLENMQQKVWVDIQNVPETLKNAVIAIEDKNFRSHSGVSWTRTVYAILNEMKHMVTGTYFGGENGIKQGASTIDQQVIKNLTRDDDVGGVMGYFRKVREIVRALKLDSAYDKDIILQAYINIMGMTENTAGVQAESIKLFNKTVDQLSLPQCASIASITKNPSRYDPRVNPEIHISRRNYVLLQMKEQGFIGEEEYNAACAAEIGLEHGVVNAPVTGLTSYFTDKVIEDVSDALGEKYGLDRAETTNLLYNGGLRVYTTVNVELQNAMEKSLKNSAQFLPRIGVETTAYVYDDAGKRVKDDAGNYVKEAITEYPQAAMVSLDYTGALKAVVGGAGEKTVSRGFNRGTDALRQVGSTMKPIGAYVLGVEKNKITWSSPFLDAASKKITDEKTGEPVDWPSNFTKTYTNEDMLVSDALAQSINTIAVRVGQKVGAGAIYNFERYKLHISSFTSKDRDLAPMVLGASTTGVTPYELAGAYMMFGNGGNFTTLHSYTSVQNGYGTEIAAPTLTTEQVIAPDTAYVMNRLLKEVMRGSGTAAGYSVKGEMDSIGKTGTSSDNRDFWFVGLTPHYVTATWCGYDSGFSLNNSQGTHAPTSAWKSVMQQAQANLPYVEFPVDATVVQQKYCTQSGEIATDACPKTATGFYRADKLPSNCKLHAA